MVTGSSELSEGQKVLSGPSLPAGCYVHYGLDWPAGQRGRLQRGITCGTGTPPRALPRLLGHAAWSKHPLWAKEEKTTREGCREQQGHFPRLLHHAGLFTLSRDGQLAGSNCPFIRLTSHRPAPLLRVPQNATAAASCNGPACRFNNKLFETSYNKALLLSCITPSDLLELLRLLKG